MRGFHQHTEGGCLGLMAGAAAFVLIRIFGDRFAILADKPWIGPLIVFGVYLLFYVVGRALSAWLWRRG